MKYVATSFDAAFFWHYPACFGTNYLIQAKFMRRAEFFFIYDHLLNFCCYLAILQLVVEALLRVEQSSKGFQYILPRAVPD